MLDVLEEAVQQDYKLFVDSHGLMQKQLQKVFHESVIPLLHHYDKKFILIDSTLAEIDKLASLGDKSALSAKHFLHEMAKQELFVKTKDKSNGLSEKDALIFMFRSIRSKYNLCIFSGNYNLSQKLNHIQTSNNILVLTVSNSSIRTYDENLDGTQIPTLSTKNSTKRDNAKKKTDCVVEPCIQKKFKFKEYKRVKLGDDILKTTMIPKETHMVTDDEGNKHKLKKQIGRTGGEGSVYLTDSGYICKIYKKEKVSSFRYEKIKLFIENEIVIPNVCLPQRIAFNSKKEFVGYLMPQAEGHEMKTSLFMPMLLKEKFPHWNRLHLVQVAIGIIDMVKHIHEYNIILGDINPNNILVKDENTIFFIDTDSFQVGRYPCPVGMIPYTRREKQSKRYEAFLRDKEDDIFALTTLLFQLMLPGKLPYSFSGGGSEKENMNPDNFAYNCYDGTMYNNAPDGQWVYMWSHLPKKLKEVFCKVFKKNEAIALDEIMKEFKSYKSQLEKGYQSKKIFPLSHKQVDADGRVIHDTGTKINCTICGTQFEVPKSKMDYIKKKNWNMPKYCDICKDIKSQAKSIKKESTLTQYSTYTSKKTTSPKKKANNHCSNCNRYSTHLVGNMCKNCRGIYFKCEACATNTFFSYGEKEFYNNKGLNYPKRCKSCRDNGRYATNNRFLYLVAAGGLFWLILKIFN